MMRRVLAGAAIGVAAFALLSDSAGAQSALCSATANGGDVTAYDSPGHALEVESDESLQIDTRAPGTSGDYQVKLEFAGVQWTVAHDSYTNGSWADSVDIATYATRGVGLYKVVATSDSEAGACSTTAYVRVKGSPLSSTAGKVAAGAAVLGLAGVGVAAARAASVPDLMLFSEAGPADATQAEWAPRSIGACSTAAVAGIGLTLAAMAHDGARTVVAMIGRVWR